MHFRRACDIDGVPVLALLVRVFCRSIGFLPHTVLLHIGVMEIRCVRIGSQEGNEQSHGTYHSRSTVQSRRRAVFDRAQKVQGPHQKCIILRRVRRVVTVLYKGASISIHFLKLVRANRAWRHIFVRESRFAPATSTGPHSFWVSDCHVHGYGLLWVASSSLAFPSLLGKWLLSFGELFLFDSCRPPLSELPGLICTCVTGTNSACVTGTARRSCVCVRGIIWIGICIVSVVGSMTHLLSMTFDDSSV